GATPAPDGREEVLEPGGRDDPHHHEILVSVVPDGLLHSRGDEAGRPRHQRAGLAVDDDVTAAAEADLELQLVGVRVLAATTTGRDGRVAHRGPAEARISRRQDGIRVTTGRDRLPVRRAFARLDDDGMARAHVLTMVTLPSGR